MGIKINIPTDANMLIHTLQDHGYSAYIVGGCVRDSILGRVPHDYDICTSATPYEMECIFNDKKLIKTGLKHGTITVVENSIPYEITTYRIDGEYTDKRRPDSVLFTDSLYEDLKRRDFTINAMAYNDEEGLHDPFGGLKDIERKRIRCVGSAKDRFEEDALRILRAIRFSSQLDFDIVPFSETSLEIHRQYMSLEHISVERIQSEFCKIVVTKSFPKMLYQFSNVFTYIVPYLNKMIFFNQNNPYHSYDVFYHTLHAIDECESDDLIVRLAVFFHDCGKPHCYQDDENGIRHFKGHGKESANMANEFMKMYRFDNETREKVVELVSLHDSTFIAGKKYVKRWLNKIGEEQLRRLLEVRKSDIKGQKENYDIERIKDIERFEKVLEEVLQEKECFTLKDLDINGKDLIALGFPQDECIGIILSCLLEDVIDGIIQNDKNILLEKAKIFLKARI